MQDLAGVRLCGRRVASPLPRRSGSAGTLMDESRPCFVRWHRVRVRRGAALADGEGVAPARR